METYTTTIATGLVPTNLDLLEADAVPVGVVCASGRPSTAVASAAKASGRIVTSSGSASSHNQTSDVSDKSPSTKQPAPTTSPAKKSGKIRKRSARKRTQV